MKTNKKLTTIAIIAMISVMTLPQTRGGISNLISNTTQTQNSPLQKISPYLQDEIRRNGTEPGQLFRVLVRYDTSVELALPKGIMVLRKFNLIPLISMLASPFEIEELAELASVEYIYPDMKVQALNDNPQQWIYPDYSSIKDFQSTQFASEPIPYNPYLGEYPCFLNESTALIGANDLWAQDLTGEGVIIAILDTGINGNHPDLDDLDDDPATCDPKILAEEAFVEEPLWEVGDPTDYVGHGTHCASIAAGTGATGGMEFLGTEFYYALFNATILPGTERGVAPGAYLYNLKVLNSEGWGYDSWIIAGIEWAMEKGADVISMSLGGWSLVAPDEDPLVLALNKAIEHGVVCVVAAGNAGWGYFTVESPGFGPALITVGATTETDELATFSSRGPEEYELHAKPDIVAPGTCIVAALNYFAEYEDYYGFQIFYWEISGTSMATPHVAGAAALLLQAFPGATPYTVKSAIMLGADDLGLDPMAQGAGRLNVATAYNIMNNAAKTNWDVPIPTNTVTPLEPMPMLAPNLTGINVRVEDSFCNNWKMSGFISSLSMLGANVVYGGGPYTNDSLVDPVSKQPLYDVFIIAEPYYVDETFLPPSVLAYYVQQNGTVLFTGDQPVLCTDYDVWTKQWGIRWDNTAVGGHSTNFVSHPITTDIHDIYFGSPIASLILEAASPSPQCIVWDPILPGVAVWEAPASSTGKVAVLSDDGILADQYLMTADNLEFGFNIIKWFTNAPTMIAYSESPLVPPIESPHPYPTYADLWYLVSVPSATWISVHFEEIDVEYGYDSIGIYDQFMNPVQYFSGYYEDVWASPVFGNMLWINLQSDYSIEYWGFFADRVMYGIMAPSLFHEIGVGGTWEKYVIANSTFTMTVDVQNFGSYTEDVALYMTLYNSVGGMIIDNWNFENVTVASGEKVSVEVAPDVVLNATTICDLAGTQNYNFVISGDIYGSSSGSPPYTELDYTNNIFTGEIAAVPKTPRSGPNPLLSVMTPMKIESQSVPLITMYPNDFTLHNITAFVGGGDLTNAEFRISGTVAAIADFVNVTTFARHYWGYFGEWLPDLSPAYFVPNTTATIGNTLEIGDVSAPTMLSAELQIYIGSDVTPGTYTGTVQLVSGAEVIASTSLAFEVRTPLSKVLWEDYFNDYWGYSSYGPSWGTDCERLWGGAWNPYVGGCMGVFEWWKLVANAGFDVDSLHQQLYFNEHLGYMGTETKDPMQIIAYGGYDTMYMHDVDYRFSYQEISVFQQLYETGKMNFVVLLNTGSEAIDMFITNYGISYIMSYMGATDDGAPPILDMLITGVDKTHPIFNGVENFTLSLYPYEGGHLLKVGPFIFSEGLLRYEGEATGIATGSSDFDLFDTSGFVVAVNELQATSHVTSRMVVVSDGNMFESLEYEDYLIWINMFVLNGENTIVSRVDTAKFAVNMLEWLTPHFSNTAPKIDHATVEPNVLKPGEAANIDIVASDAENDDFTVTIAVEKPDNTWDNATVSPANGHWLRSFTTDLEGEYDIYVIATDYYDATTTMLVGAVNVANMPPEIVSATISPSKVVAGEVVFITVSGKDAEDIIPAKIMLRIIDPEGSIESYNFTNVAVANVAFNSKDKPEGVYQVEATIEDTEGASITADIGFFEVKPVSPEPFPTEMATLGVGIIGLAVLIIILLLIVLRFSGKPKTPP